MQLHERVDYVPLPERPPIAWPNGARLAVWVSPNVEWFRPDEGGPCINEGTGGLKPDTLNAPWREYGARVGFWRMAEVLDRLGIRASVNLNSQVCEHYPQMVRAGVDRHWEFLGHGTTNSQLLTGLPEEEERHVIQEVYDTLHGATGTAPAGWMGPALCESHVTPDLLAEVGFRYNADWCDDDQPHPMRTRGGQTLISVPYAIEVNDYSAVLGFRMTGEQFGQLIRDQFDCLYQEGEVSARVMCIALHPFLSGQPHRSLHLERALQYMKGHEGVWWATGAEIADCYAAQLTR